jgi:AcrR family transcriptional regulator
MSSLAYLASEKSPSESPRRRLTDRQAATVQRLADALVGELAEVGYDELTVRNVARRAGVGPATAYTYFASKAHLVAEVFWRRVQALPETPADPTDPAAERVAQTLRAIAGMVAAEPRLAAACTPALLGPDPDVVVLRDRIGAELHRRLARAVAGDVSGGAPGDTPGEHAAPASTAGDEADRVAALDFMLAGALLQAGMGHMDYDDLADRLAAVAHLVMGARP